MKIGFVSFIIPYYNAGATIQETMDSIFNQSYPHFDVWIVNDGSTDSLSIEKLKDFEGNNRIHILHQENAGPSVARNKAISQTMAEFIVPLDADNLICKDSITLSLHYFVNDKNLSAVYGNFKCFGESTFLKRLMPFDENKSLIYNQIDTCAILRKFIFDGIIEYDVTLSKLGLEDWEFWLNFHNLGLKSKYIDITFFEFRISSNSRTFKVANNNLNEIKRIIIEKHHKMVFDQHVKLYYQKKQLLETPDYRIGNFLLKPYRWVKRLLIRK